MLMDSFEHTELGQALRICDIENNPYLRNDESGVLHVYLQRFGENNLPEPTQLEMSAGEIIAMGGDYFTDANWTTSLELPGFNFFRSLTELGRFLIGKKVEPKEQSALISAYNNLASSDVSRNDIDRIYRINTRQYIPFSGNLNFYAQQIMLYLRVKDYGEMLVRNQTHFTPWSVRVYILGHAVALECAHLAYKLRQSALHMDERANQLHFQLIKNHCSDENDTTMSAHLIDLADRYEAQAYSIELFTFHYYSDHFAAGHMSMVGMLRTLLQDRFGVWGSILANNFHDEINRLGTFTLKAYHPKPDHTQAPTPARGDGKFDSCLNQFNRKDCIAGMSASLDDIRHVLSGSSVPAQETYSGLQYMPDIDLKSRQHQPLFILCRHKIYYRKDLRKINLLSPTEYGDIHVHPEKHGYCELNSKWSALKLVAKLRLLSPIYHGRLVPPGSERLAEIRADESQINTHRQPIPEPNCSPEPEPTALDGLRTSQFQTEAKSGGLKKQGMFSNKTTKDKRHVRFQDEPARNRVFL